MTSPVQESSGQETPSPAACRRWRRGSWAARRWLVAWPYDDDVDHVVPSDEQGGADDPGARSSAHRSLFFTAGSPEDAVYLTLCGRALMMISLPAGTGVGFNVEGDQAWVKAGKPGDTRQVLAAARELRDEQ